MAAPTLLDRIDRALSAAADVFASYNGRRVAELRKAGGDPLTEVDLVLDATLRASLQAPGDGWLSEETVEDESRLDRDLVWIVDPLDGTREFIDGLPEFSTSIAAVVDGRPVAGGVLNPATGVRVLGSTDQGIVCEAKPAHHHAGLPLEQMTVLASRTEVSRGQWEAVTAAGIAVKPLGSVAYKLARVAAGLDDATWTPVPKHEWDIAGGAALLAAAGGSIVGIHGETLPFNQPEPWFSGAIAVPPGFEPYLHKVRHFIAMQGVDK